LLGLSLLLTGSTDRIEDLFILPTGSGAKGEKLEFSLTIKGGLVLHLLKKNNGSASEDEEKEKHVTTNNDAVTRSER